MTFEKWWYENFFSLQRFRFLGFWISSTASSFRFSIWGLRGLPLNLHFCKNSALLILQKCVCVMTLTLLAVAFFSFPTQVSVHDFNFLTRILLREAIAVPTGYICSDPPRWNALNLQFVLLAAPMIYKFYFIKVKSIRKIWPQNTLGLRQCLRIWWGQVFQCFHTFYTHFERWHLRFTHDLHTFTSVIHTFYAQFRR